jgi:amino acid adenylation domain-containing protein
MNIVKRVADKLRQKEFYPLSPTQEGMLFHTLYAPGSGVYVEQVCYQFQGKLNVSALEKSWQAVTDHQPALRTCFIWEDLKNPVQWARDQVSIPFDRHDWRGLSQSEQQERRAAFLKADRERGFDLAEAPLMRFSLIRLEDDRYEFIWTWHHLLMDGWSSSIVTQEVFACYQAFSQGQKPKLQPVRPYRDYIAWLRKQDLGEAESYWRQRLAGFEAPTPLIVDRSASGARGSYHEQHLGLSSATTESLQAFAQRHRLTLNTLVQGAWAALLSHYSGQQDVVFGSVVSGRPVDLAGVESMVGLFINTLPARVKVDPESGILPWLKILQAEQVAARRYEYAPLVEVEGWSALPRNLPLFESLVVFENTRYEAGLTETKGGDQELKIDRAFNYEQIHYPLTLIALPPLPPSPMYLQILYDTSRLSAATVKRMLGHLERLLETLAAPGQGRLASLNPLTQQERFQATGEWNATARAFDQTRCLHQLIEARAESSPSALAVVFEDNHLTYSELNRRSDLLAAELQCLGVGPEKLVAICLQRSAELVIALLATLKAGGAYLPLDPAAPRPRLEYILKETKATVLLAERAVLGMLPECSASVLCLDEEQNRIAQQRGEPRRGGVSPENLAYVIYTSGSTGAPKGIQISHRAVVNFLDSMREQPGLTGSDTLLAVTTLSFDIAGLELFLPLVAGGRVVVASHEAVSDGAQLLDLLDAEQVTVMQATPATYRSMIDAGWAGDRELKLLCGGEALPRDLAERLAEMSGEVWNMYGPTETTIWSAVHRLAADSGPPPIGLPIANTQIYICDSNLQPVPIGAPGEVYIGGHGVARGYLDRADLTAGQFIPDPFATEEGQRLYRTGDAARRLEHGLVEYIGRLDFQLKVRGFRIEAGEIETALSGHPAVSESVVTVHETAPGDKRLVAHLVCNHDGQPEPGELRAFLKERVPEYMIPSHFVIMERLPRTPNGKLDRRALPAPIGQQAELESTRVAPRTLLEHQLVKIWETVFNREQIGVTDNFFDLGGHSLLAVRVVAQIHKQFGQRLPLASLLEMGTIEQLAAMLHQQINDPGSPLVAIQPAGARPPLFCPHPIGGQVMVYHRLSVALGKDQPLYGLRAPEFVHTGSEYLSIEQMAARYLDAIRQHQPRGPYYLCGYSFGGYLAFEMASQLSAQGERVGALILIDTPSPALYQRLPEEDDAFVLAMLAQVRARQEEKELGLAADDLRHLSHDDQIRLVFNEVRDAGIFPPDISDEIGIPYVESYLTGYKTRLMAVFKYSPAIYPGKITLFRCAEDDPDLMAVLRKVGGENIDPAFGWSGLSEQPVEIVPVPGNHERALEKPHVRTLAHQLRICLDQALPESTPSGAGRIRFSQPQIGEDTTCSD